MVEYIRRVTAEELSTPDHVVYEGRDGEFRSRRRDGRVLCDFCTTPDPPWNYPAGEMVISGHPTINASDDAWAACDKCHDLIEDGDIQRLVRWSVKTQRRLDPPNVVRDGYRSVYPPLHVHQRTQMAIVLEFMRARTGPAYRVASQSTVDDALDEVLDAIRQKRRR